MKLTELVISLATTTQSPAGEMPTPSADSPNGTVPTTVLFPKSTTSSALAGWSLTYRVLPS